MEISGFVFCLLVSEMMASGITLSRISSIPTDPYNHPSFTDSTELSELLQQALIEQLQPIHIYPLNDYKPYSQTYATQPQTKPRQQNVSNTNHPKVNQCNQCNFNRIVSNPFLQEIMNSNLKLNEPIKVENPIKASKNIAGGVPQVVNNYIIVPPEYMQNGDDGNRKLEKNAHRGTKRTNQSRPNKGGNGRKCPKKLNEDNDPVNECIGGERRKKCENSEKNNTTAGTRGERVQKRKRLLKTKQSEVTNGQSPNLNNDHDITFDEKETIIKNVTKDEAFIQDFRKRFPSMPEEDIKTFLSFVRNRLKKQRQNSLQSETVSDNELSFDGNPLHQTQHSKNNRKRHTNRKSAHNSNDNTQNSTSTSLLETSAEHIFYDAEDINSYESLDATTKDARVSKLNPKLSQGFNEIDKTPLNVENIIDLHKKSMAGDKVTKKPLKNEVLRNINSKHNNRNKNKRKNTHNRNRANPAENKIKNQPANGYNTITRKHDSGKVGTNRFRTPPGLERPGFRTKPVMNNNFKDTKRQYEKYSTYSDIKQGTNKETYFKEAEGKKTNIETFYGHSKVVKYGGTDENDENYEAPTVTYYIPDNMEFEDDGKSVIVTRRIPNTFGSK